MTARGSESGVLGPGRRREMLRCAYCGDDVGIGVLRPGEPEPCCGSPACKREEKKAEARGGDYIENGERVR